MWKLYVPALQANLASLAVQLASRGHAAVAEVDKATTHVAVGVTVISYRVRATNLDDLLAARFGARPQCRMAGDGADSLSTLTQRYELGGFAGPRRRRRA